ncbi:carbon-nitrogen hydrolase family protein [[Clostridium] symbiosum]|uniref:carbon-nitrogen hydrolase family protein n=1 Tax=Clostridium symbiosum TaxID=1512 RepID=UPI001D0894A2|nr:carbon-nitrogen hydrolase family protein [[Clostridium] symbiosum]MCB6611558.1 carbon-nitrogen hydrolase family protein [[Clostridium] symbiosum]MCB6931782.1 carbon-nitrogen hydrolase family protein [[Clostridium] symbiosum]
MKNVRIALGQMEAVQGDTQANMAKMERMAAEAAAGGADVICFPELSYTGYFVKKDRLLEIAETENGEFYRRISRTARENGICIVAGFAERGPGEDIYNTAVFAGRDGKIAGKARKVYLWKSEKKRFVRGEEFPVFDTELGGVAILTCYDLEFPEPARIAALKGAKLIFCPAAWSVPARNRWDLDLMACSLYNMVFTAGANFADELCCGASGVAGPSGSMIAQSQGQKEEIVFADIDLDEADRQREDIPYFDDMDGTVLKQLSGALEEYRKERKRSE